MSNDRRPSPPRIFAIAEHRFQTPLQLTGACASFGQQPLDYLLSSSLLAQMHGARAARHGESAHAAGGPN